MKKIIVCFMAGCMALALFGCGSPATPAPAPESASAPEPASASATVEASSGTASSAASTASATDTSQIASTALALGATSEDNPAQVGQWFEYKKYSTESSQDETVYVRITKVIRDQTEVWKMLDAYNSEGHLRTWAPPDENDIEYGIITYEVYFPTTFPASDLGISTPGGVSFGLRKPGGGGFPSNNGGTYVGLGTTSDISPTPSSTNTKVVPGDLFSDGATVFAMVIGYNDFLIDCNYFTNDGEQHIWIKP